MVVILAEKKESKKMIETIKKALEEAIERTTPEDVKAVCIEAYYLEGEPTFEISFSEFGPDETMYWLSDAKEALEDYYLNPSRGAELIAENIDLDDIPRYGVNHHKFKFEKFLFHTFLNGIGIGKYTNNTESEKILLTVEDVETDRILNQIEVDTGQYEEMYDQVTDEYETVEAIEEMITRIENLEDQTDGGPSF